MKAFKYSRLARSAKRLIDKFGDDVTFVVNSTANAGQAWKPQTVTTTELTARAVFVKEQEKYEKGELVQTAKEKVLFYKLDLTFDPNLTGFIKRGSEKWKFSNIKTVNPGGTVVVYTAEVTR